MVIEYKSVSGNDWRIMHAIKILGDQTTRKKILEATKLNETSLHFSLSRLVADEMIKKEDLSMSGNPHLYSLTEKGLVLITAYESVN